MSMTSPSTTVKDILVAAGGIGVFAATSGWGIFVGKLPTSPDTAIACITSGGRSPYPNLLLNFPSVQVMVRGSANGYAAAEQKVHDIVSALLGLPHQVVNGDAIGGITQIGDVMSLGFDDQNRPLFSSNFSLIIEPKTGGYRQVIA